jgi:hypothetical protein
MPLLTGKKAACLITHQFPKPWMGGNQAAKQMRSLLASKGAVVVSSSIINWTGKHRDEQIGDAASSLCGIGG